MLLKSGLEDLYFKGYAENYVYQHVSIIKVLAAHTCMRDKNIRLKYFCLQIHDKSYRIILVNLSN